MNPEFEQDYTRYLAGEMTEMERQSFERRVAADPEMSEEMYADLNLASEIESGKIVKMTARWWRWAAPLAAAAVILVAVNVMGPDVEETAPVMRGGDSAIELLTPIGTVSELPTRFEWAPVAGATRYRFELMDANARLLQRIVVAETFIAADGVPDHGAWRVVALNDLGEELAASPPVQFEVAD